MDQIVIRAMQHWPNVPAVYGWLALDRRGHWLIKTVAGRFERITNPAMTEFVGRNYEHDDEGRWFFQNGPQRVYVNLEYTPWVYRLDDTGAALSTHTGRNPAAPHALLLDENGALLLDTELGVGVLLDRDLDALLEHLAGPRGEDPEALIEAAGRGEEARARWFGREITLAGIRAGDVPGRFRFVPRPAPPPGQPDC